MGARPAVEALYCHIPFCRTICPFCAFAVHGDRERLREPYLEALRREIALRAEQYGGGGQSISSLYVGGGTPSLLTLEQVRELLGWLATHFRFAPAIEIAFEVNPEQALPDYLKGLADAGVTRVSLGLQSLDGGTLAALGRGNGAEEGMRAVEAMARHAGANYNFDLMCGAPRCGEEPFREDLARVAALRPPHLSLYGLDLEPGTLFARRPRTAGWLDSHREQQGERLLWGWQFLVAQGYRHYEISNFCLPGKEGRQNLVVWDGGNYLGFGSGAHSHVDGERWHNERHIRAYQRHLGEGALPVAFRERLTPEQRANEALMLALRRQEGLAIPRWEQTCGFAWDRRRDAIAGRLAADGKALYQGQTLALTAPGLLVADAITAELMVT